MARKDILERNRYSRQLRIWSAGCATGAEPYSLAILLARELGDEISGWQVRIYATDLNRSFLAKAAEGKFRAFALRSTSDQVKRECFSREGLVWTIQSRYKQWISFYHMNLVEGEFSTPFSADTPFDLILCRNVMIYFAPEASRRLIGQFHQSLGDGGWLVGGASEHNLENYTAFRTVAAEGTKLYQKMALPSGQMEVAVAAAPKPPPPRPTAAPKQPAEPCRADLEALRQLVDHGDWKSAAECGQRLLSQDRLNPEIHFYRALIFENLGSMEESERSLRQAIYLDRHFALAHYHLGLALKRDGHTSAAARSFGNVLKVLDRIPAQEMVTAGPGVTATELKELAKMHLGNSGGS
jgi:chemotaxis protein methyltransferase CheR